jgi:transposase-like protein
MVSSKNGLVRRRLTSAQRQRLLVRYHHSQLTLKQFATRHSVGLSTLSKWLRLERASGAPAVKFQEVVLPKATSPWPVEVVSPQGWIVRLQNGSDVQMLPNCCGRCHAECHQRHAGAGREPPHMSIDWLEGAFDLGTYVHNHRQKE